MYPFDLTGPDFLKLTWLAFMLASVTSAVCLLLDHLQRSQITPTKLLPQEIAVLQLKPTGFLLGCLTKLSEEKKITLEKKSWKKLQNGENPYEKEIIQTIHTHLDAKAQSKALQKTATKEHHKILQTLKEKGILRKPWVGTIIANMYGILFAVNFIKLIIGFERGKPIWFLFATIGIQAIISLCLYSNFFENERESSITSNTKTLLKTEKNAINKKLAPSCGNDILLLYAFNALPINPAIASYSQTHYPVQTSSSSGCSTGSSCSGGSSCGGGGCGGCGS
jgi:uncharacterized protein (TIGR04222 family)